MSFLCVLHEFDLNLNAGRNIESAESFNSLVCGRKNVD